MKNESQKKEKKKNSIGNKQYLCEIWLL